MQKKFLHKVLFIYFIIVLVMNVYTKKKGYWDWDTINIDIKSLIFKDNQKDDFLWGVGTSAYQIEGPQKDEELLDVKGHSKILPQNQWQFWEGKELEKEGKKIKPVPYKSGKTCDNWNLYEKDIQRISELGFNTYRFSIAWEKIEPLEGMFNEKALDHYEEICKQLVAKGIYPVVTLYHYTHPYWFEEKKGFEDSNNIHYFVHFCKKVFDRLHKYVHLWLTINTFIGNAIPGFSQGSKPPFKSDLQLAVEVLKNLLEAHVKVYRTLKKEVESAQIGIYKNMLILDPWSSWSPTDRLGCYFGNQLTNESIFNFFTKGKLKIWMPGKARITYENKDAIGAFDFVGLNYYSGVYMKHFKPIKRPELIATEDDLYTIYPEGLYRALMEIWDNLANAKEFKKKKIKPKPIYVTETGISPLEEEHRDLFFKRHLYALSKAMEDGVDVKGYIVWTLMDGFEWQHGYGKRKYGLYEVDFKTKERKVRKSIDFLLSVVKEYSTSIKKET